jgi:hypothetical protein
MLIRLSDVLASRIPGVLNLCNDDNVRVAEYINEAVQRLLFVGGDTGWVGSYHKLVFTVTRANPYITLPAGYERIAALAPGRPMPIRNEWYEFLEEGTGPLPNPNNPTGTAVDICGTGQAFDRNNVPTVVDLTPTNQYLRVYLTDIRDVGQKILVSGALDQNGVGIYSQDVNEPVNGFLMVLTSPFTTSESIVTSFNAIGKSVTYGDVLLKQVDATTGEEVLLSRYKPNETNPAYRRYYLRSLPAGCCNGAAEDSVLVTALCKRAYSPVSNLTDYLIIGNIPALKAECESIRYSEIDNVQSQAMARAKHLEAVRLLNQELRAHIGEEFSVNFSPFGHARLERQAIGTLT